MLLERFGYKVWSTNSVEDVDVIARTNCPDMLLMDNSVPDANFEQIAERVKTVCPDLVAVVLMPFFAVHNASDSPIDRFVARDDAPDLMIAQIQELLHE
jgi:CheY-like chemotaxis protein